MEGAVALVLEDPLSCVVVVNLDDRLGPAKDVDPECVSIEAGVEDLQQERGELVELDVSWRALIEVFGSGRVRHLGIVVLVPYRDLGWLVDVYLLEVDLQDMLIYNLQDALHLGLGDRPDLDSVRGACQVVGSGQSQDRVEDVPARV